MKYAVPATASVLAVFLLGLPAHAGPILVGGTYTVAVQNFPGNLPATPVVLDSAVHPLTTSAGTLNLQAAIYDVDINTQWLDFAFSTPSAPLASNVNAQWRWTISNIPLSESALLAGVFYYWSIDGQPVDPIHNWQAGQLFPDGLDGTNPITGVGKGFGGIAATPGPLPTNNTFFVTPYRLLGNTGLPNEGDMPHLDINGFHFAFLITAANPQQITPVPEPTSLAAWGVLGLLGFGWVWRNRRHRVAQG
jgi:hypothetical protein